METAACAVESREHARRRGRRRAAERPIDHAMAPCGSRVDTFGTDLQLRVVASGLGLGLANTCIEATVRYAAELGYDVTVVKDAIASYQWEEMRAALEINLPNYATSILSAADTIAALEHTTV
jgi:hypothetical protein